MRYHAKAEGNVPFTAQEEIDRDAEEAAILAAAPERAKQAAIDLAISEFEAETAAMTASYSQAEIDTFSTQEAEAKAWSFNDTAPTPLLDAIISESGVTKAEIVMTVLNKAAALKVAVGAAIGRKQKKQRAA